MSRGSGFGTTVMTIRRRTATPMMHPLPRLSNYGHSIFRMDATACLSVYAETTFGITSSAPSDDAKKFMLSGVPRSEAESCAIPARVGASLVKPALAIDANGLGMSHCSLPSTNHLDRVSS